MRLKLLVCKYTGYIDSSPAQHRLASVGGKDNPSGETRPGQGQPVVTSDGVAKTCSFDPHKFPRGCVKTMMFVRDTCVIFLRKYPINANEPFRDGDSE